MSEATTTSNIPSTVNIALEDLRECTQILKRDNTQFERRSIVRASFAAIEAIIYTNKQLALKAYNNTTYTLHPGEINLLEEKTYYLNEQGKVKSSNSKIPSLSNLRFSFSIFCKVFGTEQPNIYGDSGWVAFQDFQQIRDRLTHPKKIEDMNITDKELETISHGIRWFINSEKTLVLSAVKKLEEKTMTNSNI